jgi:heme a synthase
MSNALQSRPPYSAYVHALASFTTVWAVLVIVFGGKTKSQEAGLTIAEPIYYQWQPDWLRVPNLNAEYIHRALVPVLCAITLLLVLSILFKDPRRSMKKLAIGLFFALLAQAMLGALTVKYFARSQTSIPHAVLGQIFLSLAASCAVLTSRYWLSDRPVAPSTQSPSLYRLCRALTIMVFIQLLLGAALRHDNRGEAFQEGRDFVVISHLVAHVMGAMGVVFFMVRVIIRINRHHRDIPELFKMLRPLEILLGVQLLLGIKAAVLKLITVQQAGNPPMMRVITATLHVLVGAIMLAMCVALMLRARRLVVSEVPTDFPQPAPLPPPQPASGRQARAEASA